MTHHDRLKSLCRVHQRFGPWQRGNHLRKSSWKLSSNVSHGSRITHLVPWPSHIFPLDVDIFQLALRIEGIYGYMMYMFLHILITGWWEWLDHVGSQGSCWAQRWKTRPCSGCTVTVESLPCRLLPEHHTESAASYDLQQSWFDTENMFFCMFLCHLIGNSTTQLQRIHFTASNMFSAIKHGGFFMIRSRYGFPSP